MPNTRKKFIYSRSKSFDILLDSHIEEILYVRKNSRGEVLEKEEFSPLKKGKIYRRHYSVSPGRITVLKDLHYPKDTLAFYFVNDDGQPAALTLEYSEFLGRKRKREIYADHLVLMNNMGFYELLKFRFPDDMLNPE